MQLTWSVVLAIALSSNAVSARAKDISVVGSSTVYPFMRMAAQAFHAETQVAVTVEATGTEAGFSYFCAGMDDHYPDINNASFPMTLRQKRVCDRNRVREIAAFLVGYDGLVLIAHPDLALKNVDETELYRAIVANVAREGGFDRNNAKTWANLNTTLPALPIRVFGPPVTSGTRMYIEEGFLRPHCLAILDRLDASPAVDEKCGQVRSDGAFVEISEDDQFLIEAVAKSPGSVGLVGYGQYQLSKTRVHAVAINGVSPSVGSIESGAYPLSRPLFIYAKIGRMTRHPEIADLIAMLFSDDFSGPGARMRQAGLVPPSNDILERNRLALKQRTTIECPSEYCRDLNDR